MSGIPWLVITYCVAAIFILLMAWRILVIKKQPVHLRWELAPVPHNKNKFTYGGSYLEDFEWWKKPRHRHLFPVVIYMASEIFMMRGIWKNNRSLWLFSISLHFGVYLFILALVLYFVIALVDISGASPSAKKLIIDITTGIIAGGGILGIIGSVSLIIKRFLNTSLTYFSSFSVYLRLVFMLAVFLSGVLALISTESYVSEMSSLMKAVITADTDIMLSVTSAVHILISYVFILYLPFTNMVHFITKYFTYHAVRWNETPQNPALEKEVISLMGSNTGWISGYNGSSSSIRLAQVNGENGEKEKPQT